MLLYSGELDKIVGEREAKATRWGGGATKIGKLGNIGIVGKIESRKTQRVNNKNATTQ